MASDVTFVLTSCGRMDLLDETLESFFTHNTYPIERHLLVEDSADPDCWTHLEKTWGGRVTPRLNREKKGQIRSIVETYELVDTPYVFHCEDDWLFTRPGFIEETKPHLEWDQRLIQTWMIAEKAANAEGIFTWEKVPGPFQDAIRRAVCRDSLDWGHFSFNPGLKRMSDYRKIGGYGRFTNELDISVTYRELGYYCAILNEPAVRHLGDGRAVHDPTRKWPKRRKWNKPAGWRRLWGHIKPGGI